MTDQPKSVRTVSLTTLNTSPVVWRVGISLILLIGALIYLIGYDYGLPYLERVDERRNMRETLVLRGLSDKYLTKPGYPPGILWVYEGAQIAVEAVTGDTAYQTPDLVVRYVRLAAIAVMLLSVYVTSLSARLLGGNLPGFLAAAVWFSSPAVTAPILVGYPQVWEFVLYSLTLHGALRALKTEKPLWVILSVGFGLGAIFFKYTAFPLLGMGVGVALWYARINWRKWLPVLGIQAVLIAGCALALFDRAMILFNSDHVETNAFLEGGFINIFNVPLGFDILTRAVELVNLPLLVFIILLIVGTLLYWRRAESWQRVAWIGVIGFAFLNIWNITTYIVYLMPGSMYRKTVPASGFLAILAAVAVVYLVRWVGERLQRPGITGVLLVAVALIWIIPPLNTRLMIAQSLTWPITPLALYEWSEQTLPEYVEKILLPYNEHIFKWVDGGYRGPDRPLLRYQQLLTHTPEEWREDAVYYVLLDAPHLEELAASPEGQAYLEQMVRLKQIPRPDDTQEWRREIWSSPEYDHHLADMTVFWIGTIDHPLEVTFGDGLHLLGYTMSAAEVQPGDTLTFHLFWQATTLPQADYHISNHVFPLDDRENLVTQADGYATRNPNRTTDTWDDPDEVFVSPDYTLAIPADLAAGDYRILVGVYDYQTGERLVTDAGDDFVALPLTVGEG